MLALDRWLPSCQLQMPPRFIHAVTIPLHRADRERYDAVQAVAQSHFEELRRADPDIALQNSAAVLELLLRMRQLACHPALVPANLSSRVTALLGLIADVSRRGSTEATKAGAAAAAAPPVELSADQVDQLLDALVQASGDDCAICLDPLTDLVVTLCAHVFDRACLATHVTTQVRQAGVAACPLCRRPLPATAESGGAISADELKARAARLDAAQDPLRTASASAAGSADADVGSSPRVTSAKLEALLAGLRSVIRGESGDAVVASMLAGATAPLPDSVPAAATLTVAAVEPTVSSIAPVTCSDALSSEAAETDGDRGCAVLETVAAARGKRRRRASRQDAVEAEVAGRRVSEAGAAAVDPGAPCAAAATKRVRRLSHRAIEAAATQGDAELLSPKKSRDEDEDEEGDTYVPPLRASAAAPAFRSHVSAKARAPVAAAAASAASVVALSGPSLGRAASSGGAGKAVVFSQWTRALDVIAARLHEDGICFVRLDGSMPASARAAAVHAFQTDPAVSVFLISLAAGCVGLTLTAASSVFLFDLPYNPAAQDQAVDRVHRLGQARAVHVYEILAAGTVEANVKLLQERKRGIAQGALLGVAGAGSGQVAARAARIDELRQLMADVK